MGFYSFFIAKSMTQLLVTCQSISILDQIIKNIYVTKSRETPKKLDHFDIINNGAIILVWLNFG